MRGCGRVAPQRDAFSIKQVIDGSVRKGHELREILYQQVGRRI